MNLKIMSLLPGFRYSSAPAVTPDIRGRMAVEVSPQIPGQQSEVKLHRSVTYREGLRLEVHVPTAPGWYPLVVYLPGGGFVVAPRAMARKERAFVAAGGFVVASVEYRTVRRQATYRDGLDDVRAAIDYLTGRADTYRIDPDRIALWGESAGGYLASMAGLTDSRIRAVVDEFGASDLSRIGEGFGPRMHAIVADPRHPIHRYRAAEANPADHIGPSLPAFLFLHGDDDRIIPPAQTLMLHYGLQAAGADSTHHLLAGAGHGQLSLSRRQARQWTSVQVMTIIKDFLDDHMRS